MNLYNHYNPPENVFQVRNQKNTGFYFLFFCSTRKIPHARADNNEELSGIRFDFFKTISGYEVEKLRIYAIVMYCSGLSC